MKRISYLAFALLFFLANAVISGCSTTSGEVAVGWGSGGGPHPQGPHGGPPGHHKPRGKGHGPPPFAPAHGYRAKFNYYYYPDAYVYFDLSRRVYFYLEGDNWRMSASLPDYISVRLRGYVSIELNTDTPYIYFHEHREKYPPGKWKKRNHKKKKDRY